MEDAFLGSNVMSYPARDVKQFVKCIGQSILDMAAIMEGNDFRK